MVCLEEVNWPCDHHGGTCGDWKQFFCVDIVEIVTVWFGFDVDVMIVLISVTVLLSVLLSLLMFVSL